MITVTNRPLVCLGIQTWTLISLDAGSTNACSHQAAVACSIACADLCNRAFMPTEK